MDKQHKYIPVDAPGRSYGRAMSSLDWYQGEHDARMVAESILEENGMHSCQCSQYGQCDYHRELDS